MACAVWRHNEAHVMTVRMVSKETVIMSPSSWKRKDKPQRYSRDKRKWHLYGLLRKDSQKKIA